MNYNTDVILIIDQSKWSKQLFNRHYIIERNSLFSISPWYKFIRILILKIILLSSIKSFSQLESYSFDSIVKYTLPVVNDTSIKMKQSKIQNIYSIDGRLNERIYFAWDMKSNSWKKEKRYFLRYYPEEVMIDLYVNEQFRQEIFSKRLVVKFDSTTSKILEFSTQLKERYSDRFKRWSNIKYTYLNDTLLKTEFYKSGTTFFLEKEIIYKYEKDRHTIFEKKYNEIEIEPESVTKKVSFINKGKVISQAIKIEAAHKAEYKDTFIYRNNLLTNFQHKVVSNTKKPISNELIDKNYSIQYFFDSRNKVFRLIQIIENEKGQSIQHPLNLLTFCFSKINSSQKLQNVWIQEIENHLDSTN